MTLHGTKDACLVLCMLSTSLCACDAAETRHNSSCALYISAQSSSTCCAGSRTSLQPTATGMGSCEAPNCVVGSGAASCTYRTAGEHAAA